MGLAETGGEQDGEVARRREHLPRSREVEITLLIARQADCLAVERIALDRAPHEFRAHDGAVVRAALRHDGRCHAERRDHAAIDQRDDRRAIAAFQHELQQHIAGVGIDALLAGLFVAGRRPGVERIVEAGERKMLLRPGRMIRRQQQPRCVADQLADGDVADVVAMQLGDIFRHRFVELELAAQHRLRHQRGLEDFAHRTDIEQRIRGDRSLFGLVGEAIVEEQVAAADLGHDCDAARAIRRDHGCYAVADDAVDVSVHCVSCRDGRCREQR